jgi:hypothetical protein
VLIGDWICHRLEPTRACYSSGCRMCHLHPRRHDHAVLLQPPWDHERT